MEHNGSDKIVWQLTLCCCRNSKREQNKAACLCQNPALHSSTRFLQADAVMNFCERPTNRQQHWTCYKADLVPSTELVLMRAMQQRAAHTVRQQEPFSDSVVLLCARRCMQSRLHTLPGGHVINRVSHTRSHTHTTPHCQGMHLCKRCCKERPQN